jgi:hypothetical protein
MSSTPITTSVTSVQLPMPTRGQDKKAFHHVLDEVLELDDQNDPIRSDLENVQIETLTDLLVISQEALGKLEFLGMDEHGKKSNLYFQLFM